MGIFVEARTEDTNELICQMKLLNHANWCIQEKIGLISQTNSHTTKLDYYRSTAGAQRYLLFNYVWHKATVLRRRKGVGYIVLLNVINYLLYHRDLVRVFTSLFI